MTKQWQREHNVPLKSFKIERLAVHFLQGWPYSHQNVFYYDWMMRDFFAYLIRFANGSLTMPGTGEIVPLGDDWKARAGEEWQAIFGTAAPVSVS